jgi:GNAT superfamily N-acetyltransferase/DNA-binding MarR family transcriptional regulator
VSGILEKIDGLRGFDRYYSQRLGLLTDNFLGHSRPLGESRLLFEIAQRIDIERLRSRLGLDAAYLVRALRSLQRQGLVRVSDGPAPTVTLTDTGVRQRTDLDRRASLRAAEILSGFSSDEAEEFIAVQRRFHRLLRISAITVRPADPRESDIHYCLDEYAKEIDARFPGGYDSSHLLAAEELGDRAGALLVAREEQRPVGCVGWQRIGEGGLAEVRHLWVGAEARGIGLGRRLLQRVETHAARHGVTTLRLGTHRILAEAISLYRTSGYHEIPLYEKNPYHHFAFEKHIVSDCENGDGPDDKIRTPGR